MVAVHQAAAVRAYHDDHPNWRTNAIENSMKNFEKLVTQRRCSAGVDRN